MLVIRLIKQDEVYYHEYWKRNTLADICKGLGAAAESTVSLEDHMPSAPPAFVKSAQTTAATGKPMSSVVLLTNMVGPGEVDEDLQTETADECAKFGKVERCLIFEVIKSEHVNVNRFR